MSATGGEKRVLSTSCVLICGGVSNRVGHIRANEANSLPLVEDVA